MKIGELSEKRRGLNRRKQERRGENRREEERRG